MRMPVAVLICAAFLLFAVGATSAAPKSVAPKKKLSASQAKKLVKEYVGEKSTKPRRMEIAETLKRIEPDALRKTLSKHCKKEAERPKTLQLAIKLKVPGLFKNLKKHFDTLDQKAIVNWCLTLKDKDGVKFLLDKWNGLSLDSKEWKRIDEGFRSHRQDTVTLDAFFAKLGTTARKTAALEVLRWQLDQPDIDAKQLRAKWGKLRREFELVHTEFAIEGHALLTMEGWTGASVDQVGSNLRMNKGSWWNFGKFPRKIGAGGMVILVRVCMPEATTIKAAGLTYVGLYCDSDTGKIGYRIDFKGSQLAFCDPSGRVIKGTPIKPGKWQEIKFVVTRMKGIFKIKIYVDGMRILDDGDLPKEPYSLDMNAADAEIFVGGIDLTYPG